MIANHLFPMPGVQLDADGIAHGARRQKQRGLLAEDLGDPLLKFSDRRIFAVYVVADFSLGHGAPHGGRRFRYRIAAQIDHKTGAPTNSAKTSFESSTPRDVSRKRLPWVSSSPSRMKRSIAG